MRDAKEKETQRNGFENVDKSHDNPRAACMCLSYQFSKLFI